MKCDDSHSQIIKILLLDALTSTSLALDWLARQPSSLHTDPGVFEEMGRKYGKYRQDRKVGSLSDGLESQSGLLNQARTRLQSAGSGSPVVVRIASQKQFGIPCPIRQAQTPSKQS